MNKNIAYDTLNQIDLFDNSNKIDFLTKDVVILHIPHASTHIPSYDGFVSKKLVDEEIELLTDWNTDEIFDVDGVQNMHSTSSRVYCDVERLPDVVEPMFKFGRGIFYTHTDKGELLRNEINKNKYHVEDYYETYHHFFKNMVNIKLNDFGKAIIIDCHSFSDMPFNTDLDKVTPRPDICIGVDEYHTPKNLKDFIVDYFSKLGYVVKINSPYSGTLIPTFYYMKNKNIQGILIEINRKLYMENNISDPNKIKHLNNAINNLFKDVTNQNHNE